MIKKRISFQKIMYKVLTVLLCVFWLFFAVLGLYNYMERAHLYPLKYKDLVFEYSELYNLDKALIFSVIKVESGFNDNAESKAGALGLMQITPKTAEYIASLQGVSEYDIKDTRTNIRFGCFYLNYLLKRFKNCETALVAYNAGEGNVSLWLNNPEYSENKITLKFIPFPESREYIKKINQTFTKYKKLYGNILDK